MRGDSKFILDLTKGKVVCECAAIAERPSTRLRGMLGRDSLPAGEGLLLWPAPSIHTAFMRFAIDAVFVDAELRVLKIVEGLRPWRVASAHRARGVLELAAGQANARGIEVGDRLGAFDLDWEHATTGAIGHVRRVPPGHDEPFDGGGRSRPPAKVLVLTRDARFRAVCAALLMRRGCLVSVAEPAADAPVVVRRSGAEVVLFDVHPSPTASARELAQLKALDPPVGLVMVSEEPERDEAVVPVADKWGSFEALCDAIESARPGQSMGDPRGRE
jgi:uncharacterized membrane protein (UPF0127 family)